ncbi:MAG: hypothetical protein PHF57_08695 [Methanoregula sp.]|nr:hypothetical protein [Methanoregula sp.]
MFLPVSFREIPELAVPVTRHTGYPVGVLSVVPSGILSAAQVSAKSSLPGFAAMPSGFESTHYPSRFLGSSNVLRASESKLL